MISDPSPRARGKARPGPRPAGDAVMLGRAAEQKIVRALLRCAEGGRGGVVLVEGEPGTGKSLLLRESAGEASRLGFSLTAGAADRLGRAVPFFALRAALPDPFATTAEDGRHDLPGAAQRWISRVRAYLE
jgi:predicted ATPase